MERPLGGQNELNEYARWPMCQTTHCDHKQTELSECARWPMCQTTICNAFSSYFLLMTFTSVLRTIKGYTVYIYVNRLIHSYTLKDIYSRLALLSLFFLYALVFWPTYFYFWYLNQKTPKTYCICFLPLYYNQFWTLLPNTSQYFFGQLKNMMLYNKTKCSPHFIFH